MSEQPQPETTKLTSAESASARLDPELQAPVDDGTLRFISESPPGCAEFAIDQLAHRMRGGAGWIDIHYRLTVDANASVDEYRYVVEDDSEQGGDARLSSNDPDEVAAWIKSEIEEKGDD